jgi:hypothetical protein
MLEPIGKSYPEEIKAILKQRKASFVDNIRAINGNFAMASMSIRQYQFKTGGPYCFRISGQIYRNMNTAAMPEANNQPTGGQLFFIDTNNALDLRKNKLKADHNDIALIHNYLSKHNAYAKAFHMLKEEIDVQERQANDANETRKEIKLLFNSATNHDPRRYNLPQTNEVAAVFVADSEGNVPEAHITVHEKGKKIKNLQHIDPNVEPMLYPVFYPDGKQGWNVKMKTKSGKKLSLCDYINFHLHYRNGIFNPLHYGGKLSQQWIVERWCCVESERLLYLRLNQNKIKAASYSGLQDWLSNANEQLGTSIGRQIILPSTYTGGPRYMITATMMLCAFVLNLEFQICLSHLHAIHQTLIFLKIFHMEILQIIIRCFVIEFLNCIVKKYLKCLIAKINDLVAYLAAQMPFATQLSFKKEVFLICICFSRLMLRAKNIFVKTSMRYYHQEFPFVETKIVLSTQEWFMAHVDQITSIPLA